jgi:hypothetical protein
MLNRKKTFLITLLLAFSSLIVFGQKTKFILTKDQNSAWLDSLSSLSLPSKIELIKQRIFADTLVYNTNQHGSDRIILDNEKRSTQKKSFNNFAEGRLLFVIVDNKKKNRSYWRQGFTFNNWTDNKDVTKFCDFLSIDKIYEINTMDNDKVKAVFSYNSEFGAIGIILKKRKYIKELIRLDLNK